MESDEENNVLYELLVHFEWLIEKDVLNKREETSFNSWLQTVQSKFLSFSSFSISPVANNQTLQYLETISKHRSEWELAVGSKGAVIALLQQTSLEIRTKKDDYTLVVGKTTNLYNDPFPSWRKLTWSSDCSMLALGYTNGVVEIFNTLGSPLFKIYPSRFQESWIQKDRNDAFASLFFSEVRTENLKWNTELFLIDYHGNIRSYYVSPTEGYQESSYFKANKIHPGGITASANLKSLIILAGPCMYESDQMLKNYGIGHGITLWKIISEFPYYKHVSTIDEDDYIPRYPTLLTLFSYKTPHDHITCLSVSPLGRQIAALHVSGSISIWHMPSLRKKRFWMLDDQPRCLRQKEKNFHHLPIDVKWWSEDALIIVRMSGAVTVSSVNSLRNLLGESPEYLVGTPCIAEANDKYFLALETEVNRDISYDLQIVDKKQYQLFKIIKKFINWAIDSESYEDKNILPLYANKIYRLLSLNSTTPEELYIRKIEMEEYGDALNLANTYNLDCDLVYKRQWQSHPATIATIDDYLSKLKKRSLVLEQCLTRVPENIDAARELLLFGLRGTELDTLVAIGNGTDDESFILSDLSLEYEDDSEEEISHSRVQELANEDLRKRAKLISQIDFKNLLRSQLEVINARQKLLQYYDRLTTYEAYLGGDQLSYDAFDHKFYSKFRKMDEVEACLEFARYNDWRGVDTMFIYHSEEILPHRIAILSNFPPIANPLDYKLLLPELDLSGQVFEHDSEKIRDEDWCEDELFRTNTMKDFDAHKTLYEGHPYLLEYKNIELNGENVSKWYQFRAREIENCSLFVDTALDLLKLGRERRIPGLDSIIASLESVEVLVYEVGLTKLTLSQYESYSSFEKLKLFMSTSEPDDLLQNLIYWGIPFLNKCEEEPGDKSTLLKSYVVSTSKEDLSLALKVIQGSKLEDENAIFSCIEDVLNVAIDSIYECEKPSQLPRAFAILDNMPVRDRKYVGNEHIISLYTELDVLEEQLIVADILSNYEVLVTAKFLKEAQRSKKSSLDVFKRVIANSVKRERMMKPSEWKKLIKDCLEIQLKVLYDIEPLHIFEIVAESMLSSGVFEYIECAKDFLVTDINESPMHNPYLRKIDYDRSVELILTAATNYFNTADSYKSDDIMLSRYCLKLIQCERREISEEMDLISSLQILPDIGIKKIPLQVRLCENRIDLIKEALESSSSMYCNGAKIIHLAKLLRVCQDDKNERQRQVCTLLASAALQASDYETASVWCDVILDKGHKESWSVCADLGRQPAFTALKLRAKLLDFALTYCPHQFLEDLLRDRNEIELSLLYSNVQLKMRTNLSQEMSTESEDQFEDATSMNEDSFEEFSDVVSEERILNVPMREMLKKPFSLTKDIISASASTTAKIASTVSARKFWKSASGWLAPIMSEASNKIETSISSAQDSDNFEVPKCHAFYSDYWISSIPSSLSTSYDSYTSVSVENLPVSFPLSVLRIALISETLSEHSADQIVTVEVKKEVAKRFLLEDIPVGLSFLLSMLSVEESIQVLNSLPKSELSLQICLYYYSLQIYSKIATIDKPIISPCYLTDPYLLVLHIKNYISDKDIHSNILYSHFIETYKSISKLKEGQELANLSGIVDINRFMSDPTYKQDTVLGLALNSDKEIFNLAVSLATKYDVPLIKVYFTHLQHIFETSSIEEIQKFVEDEPVFWVFSENCEEFETYMNNNIFILISGKDYEKLFFYYNILKKTVKSNENYGVFVEVLEEAKQLGVDFKHIMTDKNARYIKKDLAITNVEKIAHLGLKLAPMCENAVHKKTLYKTLANKIYYQNKDDHSQGKSQIQRFTEVLKLFKHMDEDEINSFIKKILVNDIPLDFKTTILNKSIKALTAQEYKGISELKLIKDHFSRLNSNSFKSLLESPDSRKYAKKLECSLGDETQLCEIPRQILQDYASFSVLRNILAQYPEEQMIAPEDIFLDTFNSVIEELSEGSYSHKSVSLLDHLLREFAVYSDEGGELLTEDEILDTVRSFCSNEEYSKKIRTTVLELAQKHLTMEDEDSKTLQVLKTDEIVEKVLTHDINKEYSDVNTEEGRRILFDKMLSATMSYEQAHSLFELLSIWPPFHEDVYSDPISNPWLRLIFKITDSSNIDFQSIKLIRLSVNHAFDTEQLNRQQMSLFVPKLLQCGYLKETSKIGLLGNEACIECTLEELKLVQNLDCDVELLELIVKKKLVARILQTSLYPNLHAYLKDCGKSELVANAAEQLKSAGNYLEAASLDFSLQDALKSAASMPLLKSIGKFF